MLRLRSCRPSTRRLSNANLQHLWENEQAARSQKRKAGSHSIEVSVNNDSEKYNILVPKGKTYRDVAMYVSYLQASNSCAALHEDFAKEENERGEYSEVPAMRSMYDEVTSNGRVQFLNSHTRPRHLYDQNNYTHHMRTLNNSVYTTGQIILLEALKRALPESTKVSGFRRPTYDFKEAPAFAYDVLVENGDFLKESFDESASQEAEGLKNVLKNERLNLINTHARQILQEKVEFQSINIDTLASPSRGDVDLQLRYYLGGADLAEGFKTIDDLEDPSLKLVKFGDSDSDSSSESEGHVQAMRKSDNTLPNAGFLKHFAATNMTLLCNVGQDKSIYRIQGICSPEILDPEVFRILELNAQRFVKNDLLDTLDLAKSFFQQKQVQDLSPEEKSSKNGNGLWSVDFNPVYCSLESDLKYFNNKMQSSLLRWLTPHEKPVALDQLDSDMQKLIFEKENLKNLMAKSEKSVAMKQARDHKFGPMYETSDQHKHFLYQGDAALHLGLRGEKFSQPGNVGEKRWEEWNQALHFICMIGGPIIQDSRWYRRKYLNPRAMGRWDATF